MGRSGLPIGCSVRIEKPDLQAVIDRLLELGYRVHRPQGAGIGRRAGGDRLAPGPADRLRWTQEAGTYRLEQNGKGAYFDYVVGPHSLKDFVFPPQSTLLQCRYEDGRLLIDDGGRSRPCPWPCSASGRATCTPWRLRTASSWAIAS